MNSAEQKYRESLIQNATPVELTILLYERLALDLQRAAEAMRAGNIEQRVEVINHALVVVGQLDDLLDMNNGGEAATSASRFHSYLRAKMMEAQIKLAPQMLMDQITLIGTVCSAWRRKRQEDATVPMSVVMTAGGSSACSSGDEQQSSGWTA